MKFARLQPHFRRDNVHIAGASRGHANELNTGGLRRPRTDKGGDRDGLLLVRCLHFHVARRAAALRTIVVLQEVLGVDTKYLEGGGDSTRAPRVSFFGAELGQTRLCYLVASVILNSFRSVYKH